MTIRELRIGNLVYFDKQEIVIDLEYFYAERECNGVLEHTEPITLAGERLLKFGFKYHNEFDSYVLGDVIIRAKDYVLCDIGMRVKIEHVHSLQNLYFELKGKELEE